MPKRNRDGDEQPGTDGVIVKEEGAAAHAEVPVGNEAQDLDEVKEMLKDSLDLAAKVTAEKAEMEAQLAALRESKAIQEVHTLFGLNLDGEGKMRYADIIPNPNLLNVARRHGADLDWTRQKPKVPVSTPGWNVPTEPGMWYYINVESWTEALKYFEEGVGAKDIYDEEEFEWPDPDAVASVVVLTKGPECVGEARLVVGALSYRISQSVHQHLYKEKYKKETEELWPDGLGIFPRQLRLEGGGLVPDSLRLLTLPFDATLKGVFLPTNLEKTTGAMFDLDMDKMIATDSTGNAKSLFSLAPISHRNKV